MTCRRCFVFAVFLLVLSVVVSAWADSGAPVEPESVISGQTMIPLGAGLALLAGIWGAGSAIIKRIDTLKTAVAAVDTKLSLALGNVDVKLADFRHEVAKEYASKESVAENSRQHQEHLREFDQFKGEVMACQAQAKT